MFSFNLNVVNHAVMVGALMFAANAFAAEETREVDEFSRINYTVPYDVELVWSEEPYVKIEGDEDTIDELRTEVKGNELKVYKKESWFDWSDGKVAITIGYTALEQIRIAGSGDAFAEEINVDDLTVKIAGSANFEVESLVCNNLKISIAGSGDVELHSLEADAVHTSIAGSGNVEMGGEVVEQDVSITGSGDHNARDLRSQEANVSIRGSGDVEIWVASTLSASVIGSGDIHYYGEPNVDRSVVGSGNIEHRGDQP